jgi:hypothetical protein
VLLFVQSDDNYPPVVSPTTKWQRGMLLEHGAGYCSGGVIAILEHVRWWLVECENADAGRETIAQHGKHLADRGPGRILASGVSRPAEREDKS